LKCDEQFLFVRQPSIEMKIHQMANSVKSDSVKKSISNQKSNDLFTSLFQRLCGDRRECKSMIRRIGRRAKRISVPLWEMIDIRTKLQVRLDASVTPFQEKVTSIQAELGL
jgi:hypothetical protein